MCSNFILTANFETLGSYFCAKILISAWKQSKILPLKDKFQFEAKKEIEQAKEEPL